MEYGYKDLGVAEVRLQAEIKCKRPHSKGVIYAFCHDMSSTDLRVCLSTLMPSPVLTQVLSAYAALSNPGLGFAIYALVLPCAVVWAATCAALHITGPSLPTPSSSSSAHKASPLPLSLHLSLLSFASSSSLSVNFLSSSLCFPLSLLRCSLSLSRSLRDCDAE
eukprot:1671891-Rhodomonas_salina.1